MQTTESQPQLLDKIVATLGELPTSPAVVSTVMGLTADLNTEINELTRVLSGDPALTAKVLRLSNSPFYGRARTVGSLNEAVMILGFHTIRSLVVASSTYSLFRKGKSEKHGETLWAHSLGTGLAARIVAKHVRHPNVEEAFIVGLLHDIGKLILLQKMPSEYKDVISTVETTPVGFAEAERTALGFDHCQLGSIVLSRWNFPESLCDAVACHHQLESSESAANVQAPLAFVVALANALAQVSGYGFIEEYSGDLANHPAVDILELDHTEVIALQEELTENYSDEKALFEER